VLFLITVFIFSFVVNFLLSMNWGPVTNYQSPANHFHAWKYEGGGGTITVLPSTKVLKEMDKVSYWQVASPVSANAGISESCRY